MDAFSARFFFAKWETGHVSVTLFPQPFVAPTCSLTSRRTHRTMSRVATIPCLSPASTSGSTPRARSRVHRLSVRARSWQGQNEKSRSATGPHKVKVPLPVDGPLAPPQDVVDAVAAWP